MEANQIISEAKQSFEKAITHLEQEFGGIHSGRASTSLVENINIEAYGIKQPIKALAQITVTEATQLTIQPWDQGLAETIASVIREKNLGFSPQSDGHVVRVNIPPMTEERRQQMTKLISKIAENTRITIRNAREDARKVLKKLKEDKKLSEDDWETSNENLQKIVDEFNEKVESKEKIKTKEILTV